MSISLFTRLYSLLTSALSSHLPSHNNIYRAHSVSFSNFLYFQAEVLLQCFRYSGTLDDNTQAAWFSLFLAEMDLNDAFRYVGLPICKEDWIDIMMRFEDKYLIDTCLAMGLVNIKLQQIVECL